MVLTTYVGSAFESDSIGPSQLYILVVVPDSILVPILIVLVGDSRTVPSGSVQFLIVV